MNGFANDDNDSGTEQPGINGRRDGHMSFRMYCMGMALLGWSPGFKSPSWVRTCHSVRTRNLNTYVGQIDGGKVKWKGPPSEHLST